MRNGKHKKEQRQKKMQILKGLEPPQSSLSNLVGGFVAIAIGTIALGMASQSLKAAGLLDKEEQHGNSH